MKKREFNMGKIYNALESIEEPDFDLNVKFDFDAYIKDVERYRKEIVEFAKQHGKGKFAGKLISFPFADGSADYVVFSLSPVKLIHLSDGDAYQYPYAHRLTASDIKERLK